jgi:hypothetical protein
MTYFVLKFVLRVIFVDFILMGRDEDGVEHIDLSVSLMNWFSLVC